MLVAKSLPESSRRHPTARRAPGRPGPSSGRGCRGPSLPCIEPDVLVGRGKSAMPNASWSLQTRFCVTRLSRPPFTMIPIPSDGYSRSNDGASALLLSWTQLPAIRASCCGASASESRVFGTIPARLSRLGVHDEQVAAGVRARIPHGVVLGEHASVIAAHDTGSTGRCRSRRRDARSRYEWSNCPYCESNANSP